jgi:protein-S-isoprenylcysteine O-methyltransferase Ste14
MPSENSLTLIHQIIAGLWILMGIIWLAAAIRSKRVVRMQSAASRFVQIGLSVLGFLMVFDYDIGFGPLDRRVLPPHLAAAAAGLALTVLGMALALWARVQIGGNWSSSVTLKESHELIRSGPYAFVRHPIYSGLLLALLGAAISYGAIRGFIGVALAVVAWKLKSATEESFMSEQFGEQYALYRRQVKAFIPFVW